MNKSRDKKIGVILSYMTIIFNSLITIVYTPYIISKLGDSNYGVLSLATSSIALIGLLDLGLGNTTIRYITKYRSLGEEDRVSQLLGFFCKAYSVIAFVAMIVGVILAFVYPKICGENLTPDEMLLYRQVVLILLINTVFSFPLSVFMYSLNAFEKFSWLKGAKLMCELITYASLFFVLSINKGLIWVAFIMSATSLTLQLSYFIIFRKEIKVRCSFAKIDKAVSMEIMAYSFFILLNTVADFLYAKTDKMILGASSGSTEVSVYTIGVQFQSLFNDLAPAISTVFFPAIITNWEKGNFKGVSAIFSKVARMQMMVVGLMVGGFVVFGSDFISLWVGDNYQRSYLIGLIIIIPAFIPLTQTAGAYVLRAMNIQKYRSYAYLFFAIVNVIISIPMAKLYGGVGAAIGTLISTVLGQIIFMNWFYAKKAGLDIIGYWKDICKELVLLIPLSAAFIVGLRLLNIGSGWGILILEAMIYACIYILLYFIFLANEAERQLVKDIGMKLFRR